MKNTAKNALFLFCASALGLLANNIIFHEDFETPEKNTFNETLSLVTDAPAAGKISAQLVIPTDKDRADTFTPGVYPVNPDSWYRLTFKHKNDIKNGELKIGVRESRDATTMVGEYYAWQWKALPLNISDWNSYAFEFKTATDTQAVRIHMHTENQKNGSSWWDDLTLNSFTPVYDPLEIKPFRAAATYTDIPTKMAYRVTEGEPTPVNLQVNTTYHWQTLDITRETVTVLHRNLPDNSKILLTIKRGNQDSGVTLTQSVTGAGETRFELDLTKFSEGIYEMTASTQLANGETFTTPAKELWRIQQKKCAAPKLEPIKTSTIGPNRQRLVNGKIYHPVHFATAPTWGLFGHHNRFTKPDLETYFNTLQEQFGQDCFGVWAWRANRWDDKKAEFAQDAIRQYREYMDFLLAHNAYALPGFMFSTERGRPETADFDDIRALAQGVKDHPALLEWSLDEPEIPRYSPEMMAECYKILKEVDPSHIVNVNLCDPAKFHLYAPCTDIGSFDVYPFPGMNLLENDKRMSKLIAAFPGAPLDSYLQMFNFNTLAMPCFDQVRAEFIFDRISGSMSLVAYSWGERRQSFQTDMELQAYFRAILFMFRSLNPVLDRAVKTTLNLTTDSPYVKSMALKDDAETVVLLVNISPDTDATIAVPTHATTAENFFDSAWTFPIANGSCKLTLGPNKTAVIRLQ